MKRPINMSQKIKRTRTTIYVLMLLLVIRLAYLQFVNGSDLKKQMYNQLITSRTITPKGEQYMTSTRKALAIAA